MWPSLLLSSFTLVSLVICRGGEWGALWFSRPSHQVLRPCSRQFSVFLLSHIIFFSPPPPACSRVPGHFAVRQAQFCRENKKQAYLYCMHSASVNTFCRSPPLHHESLLQTGLLFVLLAAVLKLHPCLYTVSLHTCLGAPISVINPGAFRFTPSRNFN